MKKTQWFKKTKQELEEDLMVNVEQGLSEMDVVRKTAECGTNILTEQKRIGLFGMFINQFKDFMVIILMIASILSGMLGEKTDTIVIMIVVVFNAILGVIQESKAEKSLDALKKLSSPMAKVIRDGILIKIKSEDLVPGDVMVLETGDFVPADGVLFENASLMIEESALTGESVPVEKNINIPKGDEIPLGDRLNYVFTSSLVTKGRGKAIVTETGMNTEIGKIAGMLQNQEEGKTPLQRKLDDLGKTLGIGALAVCGVIFIIGYLQGRELIQMFMTSVSLAVAAIPEGLPAIVTIVLSIGVQKMIRNNAIVRKLPAVETLGTASVICSDKTGTLTQNKMTVKKIYTYNNIKDIEDLSDINSEEELTLKIGLLCNDAQEKIGDPTEKALLKSAKKFKMDKQTEEEKSIRVNELPFDSNRKLMSTVHKCDSKYRVFTKGAVDFLLDKCSKIYIDGEERSLTSSMIEVIKKSNEDMSSEGLRVIAFAYKEENIEPKLMNSETLENGLVFVGLQGMIDPPREEVKVAVEDCKKAGIKTVMITGDHKITAIAIAEQLGILKNKNEAIEGHEIEKMSDEQLSKNVEKYSVYARVSPEHKVRIVTAWQSIGKVVAMTGDGVNDAPALKKADIGCAMGITGTDVSKQAADMVLTDDNFTTIVSAVKEGRHIFDNIRKSIHFLLSCNMGEIVALFLAVVLRAPLPLLPIHILWVNLVTDSLPALGLGLDPAESDIMERSPRDAKKSMFADGLGFTMIVQGMMIGVLTKIAFQIGFLDSLSVGRTMAFCTLCFSQLAHSFNVRSVDKSLFKIGFSTNKSLIKANAVSAALILIVTSIPILREIFKLSSLSLMNWIVVATLSVTPLFIIEFSKLFKDDNEGEIEYKYSVKADMAENK